MNPLKLKFSAQDETRTRPVERNKNMKNLGSTEVGVLLVSKVLASVDNIGLNF